MKGRTPRTLPFRHLAERAFKKVHARGGVSLQRLALVLLSRGRMVLIIYCSRKDSSIFPCPISGTRMVGRKSSLFQFLERFESNSTLLIIYIINVKCDQGGPHRVM